MEEVNKVPYGFIYQTTNKINGMKYIGKCIYGRINNWQTYLGSGVYLKRAIVKYGKENFQKEILADAFSDEELNLMEETFIKEMNAVEDDSFYNLKYTSMGGDVFTNNPRKEEIRKMRRDQMTGEGNHQFGKQKTKKMIDSVKKANSREIEIDGISYKSSTEASKALGLPNSTICYRLNEDGFPTYKRFHEKREKNTNKCFPIEIEGIRYENMVEASVALGVNISTLKSKIARGEIKNYKKLY